MAVILEKKGHSREGGFLFNTLNSSPSWSFVDDQDDLFY
jgi:hypothetical protein